MPCYNVSEPKAPLALNEKHSLFKLFMGDVGLLCAACMENVQLAILQGDLEINMGSILENVIAQQIKSAGFALHFDVFCQENIEQENGVVYLPWYEIMFLQPDRLPETLKFEVNLSGLP